MKGKHVFSTRKSCKYAQVLKNDVNQKGIQSPEKATVPCHTWRRLKQSLSMDQVGLALLSEQANKVRLSQALEVATSPEWLLMESTSYIQCIHGSLIQELLGPLGILVPLMLLASVLINSKASKSKIHAVLATCWPTLLSAIQYERVQYLSPMHLLLQNMLITSDYSKAVSTC